MTQNRPPVKKRVGRLILWVMICLSIPGCSALTTMTMVRDDTLIRVVHSHRASLEKMLAMVTEDGIGVITISDFRNPPIEYSGHRIDAAREQEYVRVFSEIRPCMSAALVDTEGYARFVCSGWSGGVKGIERIPHFRGITVQNLDSVSELPEGLYWRQIEPEWYIFYQRNDD